MLTKKVPLKKEILLFEKEELTNFKQRANAELHWYKTPKYFKLQPGLPFLLLQNPEFGVMKDLSQKYEIMENSMALSNSIKLHPGQKVFETELLLQEKVYIMFLTRKQYNHHIVKAAPRRIEKIY